MFFKIPRLKFSKSTNVVELKISLKREVLNSIISYCKMRHPDEGILILRGKSKNRHILIDGLIVPPFSFSSHSSSGFPRHMLPYDSSYVGTVHSHPSGNEHPSITDLNNFFELISIIVRFPYSDSDIFAWNSNGKPVLLQVV